MSGRETLSRLWMLSTSSMTYPRILPWIMVLVWAVLLVLAFFSDDGDTGDALRQALICMIFFMVANATGEQAEEREHRRLLWGRLPLSRRLMAWARVLTSLWLVSLGLLTSLSIFAVFRWRGHEEVYALTPHLLWASLFLLAFRLGKSVIEEIGFRLSGKIRLAFAAVTMAALISALILWMFPFLLEEQKPLLRGPWTAGLFVLGLGALACISVEGFVRRPSLEEPSLFDQLDRVITGCGR